MVHHVIQYFHVINGGTLIGPSVVVRSKTPQADSIKTKAVHLSDNVLSLTRK